VNARFAGEFAVMTASFATIAGAFRRPVFAAFAAAALLLPALPGEVQARGPEHIADVAESVIDAVVNISTSQRVEAQTRRNGPRQGDRRGDDQGSPQVPPGSPCEDFFKDFFENRRGPGG